MKNFFVVLIGLVATFQVIRSCSFTGECIESDLLSSFNVEEELKCQNLCEVEKQCQWFTYSAATKSCRLYKNCLAIQRHGCSDCISKELDCKETECWISGECHGNDLLSEEVLNENECLELCRSSSECQWFTFLKSELLCTLFIECDEFDGMSSDGISGRRTCQKRSVYSKVLVGLGTYFDYYDDVEAIDLLSPNTTCKNLANFPFKNANAVGGLGYQEKPIICGGMRNSSFCHLYEDNVWKKIGSLVVERISPAITQSPFSDSKLFITGGIGAAAFNLSEELTQNGWLGTVPLPVEIHSHCMVLINSSAVMIIGGYQGLPANVSDRTLILNTDAQIWSEGPSLIQAREAHSCALIKQDADSDEMSIIVVGGFDDEAFNSVEVLDLGTDEWQAGPDLPYGVHGAALVEDPQGGVVLIGGNTMGRFTNTLLQLKHAGEGATWIQMQQRLNNPRAYHTAFLVPDDIVDCQ